MNFYRLGRFVACNFLRLFLRISYEGTCNIPQEGSFILACNHRSFCDPIVIAHRVRRQIHYIAKAELVGIPVLGRIIRGLGVIPVKRGSGDGGVLDAAVEVVEKGGILGIFPEGTRSRDGKPLRPRSGVCVIAGKARADILPCAVSYPPGGARLFARVTVRYGPLIKKEELNIDPDSPSAVRAGARAIMDAIVGLLDNPAVPGGDGP
ncbi:MAG: 1-acyl-sn-glycerol-3-phosphate acyltransferase [Oscillospiraceae bacterium]|jgi:1-acyl-sn-glycerol-3-phosphate acyltransferase|nr:1-acyl-sn-glycerol-3-phosphate acyltransferase [Oscillospiraceae bacterium]